MRVPLPSTIARVAAIMGVIRGAMIIAPMTVAVDPDITP